MSPTCQQKYWLLQDARHFQYQGHAHNAGEPAVDPVNDRNPTSAELAQKLDIVIIVAYLRFRTQWNENGSFSDIALISQSLVLGIPKSGSDPRLPRFSKMDEAKVLLDYKRTDISSSHNTCYGVAMCLRWSSGGLHSGSNRRRSIVQAAFFSLCLKRLDYFNENIKLSLNLVGLFPSPGKLVWSAKLGFRTMALLESPKSLRLMMFFRPLGHSLQVVRLCLCSTLKHGINGIHALSVGSLSFALHNN